SIDAVEKAVLCTSGSGGEDLFPTVREETHPKGNSMSMLCEDQEKTSRFLDNSNSKKISLIAE
ncbi:hypothetical protein P7K49_012537, partial [Saguinus oedipus]